MNCPLFTSPQHIPGSDRIKGQTLFFPQLDDKPTCQHTCHTVSTSQKVKSPTFGHYNVFDTCNMLTVFEKKD